MKIVHKNYFKNKNNLKKKAQKNSFKKKKHNKINN